MAEMYKACRNSKAGGDPNGRSSSRPLPIGDASLGAKIPFAQEGKFANTNILLLALVEVPL